MHILGRGRHNPPLKKALEERYWVEMNVHKPIFQIQLIENRIRPITLIVWVQREGCKKCQKKG